MSLKDLFKEQDNLKSAEPLTKEDFKDEIESFDYAEAINKRNARFVATEDFEDPSNFARFGLAEKYYQDAITRIHDSYPYDGSLKEKVLWEVSSSLIDLHIFENGYPRTTGFANFVTGAATTGNQSDFYPPVDYLTNGFEYILAKGGPHAGSGDSLYYDQITDKVVYRKDANVFDLSNNRENNLLIDGTKGNTVEFWLKKDAYVADQDYFEFIVDTHVTGTTHTDADYGRLIVALATTGTFDNAAASVATMTGILDDGTIPTALNTQTITITDAVGLTKTYKFMNGGAKSNGDLDGGNVVVQLSGENTKEGLVDNIEQSIESSNGHNGSIVVTRVGAVLTLAQSIVGSSGNTDIEFSNGIDTTTELNTTNFSGGSNGKPIFVSYASGSSNIRTYLGSNNLTTSSVADGSWHHYAIRMKTTGSNTVFDLFVDGKHNDETSVATTVGYVSGAIVATLGSQASQFYDGSGDRGARGWSPLSGAIDEFRYWKRWRTSKQIQTRWFDQVGGGTNTDLSNTDLGVYFKFNEGITQTASVDATVLDYSGRVSNGVWTGYNSTLSRDTGSAILQSSASLIEFKDPIVYSFHPDVVTYKANMMGSGSIYDDSNVNSLKSYFPAWMLEQSETERADIQSNYLLNLLQIISSYFDEAAILLKKLPQLSHAKYYKGSGTPPPFNKKALESAGFMVPDIFVDASLLEKFESRDEELKFERDIQEVKNVIYQNIYNNLTYLYKTKGTEKSIRNLLRCFGIGDNVLKINLYGNESVYKLEDNLKSISKIKKYINFNEKTTAGSNDEASIYQYKIDSNATSFIAGTNAVDGTFEGQGLSFTLESNVLLPNRVSIAEYATVKEGYKGNVANLYPLHITSSLFGMHTANGVENSLTWATNDYANFQVTTVKDDLYSSNAYFKLTGTAGGFIPELTSSVFNNIYDDQLWTISVTVEPTKLETINQVSGTSDSDYTVRFYGVNHIADYKANEFLVTGTISNDFGRKILSSPKRVFVGAHRTNFTSQVLEPTDVKVNSCKAWFASIPTGTIDNHNLKLGNFGAERPTRNAFLYQSGTQPNGLNERYIPEAETLALLWNFSTVTASNVSGEFSVEDESSGSVDENRYGWFSSLVSRRHTASGSFFMNSSSDVVESIERTAYHSQVPEVLTDSNLTRILSEDDEYFDRNNRPTTYNLSIEKNLFQDISEEMLDMFSSAVWFNNMIGNPVNMYRGEYKELKKAADLFFEKVGNDYDFDKYVEYFKFIDYSISRYLIKLIPASMLNFRDGVSTMIENFALGDRTKFRSKFPTIKNLPAEFEGSMQKPLFSFMQNTPPLNPNQLINQDQNCLWWKNRAERDKVLSTGDSLVDSDREKIRQVANNLTNTPLPTFRSGATNYQASASVFLNRSQRTYSVAGEEIQQYHAGGNSYKNKKVGFWDSIRKRPTPSTPGEGGLISIEPTDSKLEQFKDCSDDLTLNQGKRKYNFSVGIATDSAENFSDVFKGDLIFPFSLYSSSISTNPAMADLSDFQPNLAITNLHHDSYGIDADIPMQGPFTEKYVGGRPYRHVMSNFSPAQAPLVEGQRLEGWRITGSTTAIDLLNVSVHNPKSVYLREEYAKRPVNIKNIQQTTGASDTKGIHAKNATIIGNYTNTYEILMTNGRTENNRYMAESDGALPTTTTDSAFVSGVVDFTLPRRDLTGSNTAIIVNRFSAPGSPSTMGEGMLDVAAGEYSVYNVLPFRNLDVRLPLNNQLYSNHANQFGYFSDQFRENAFDEAGITYPGGSSSVSPEGYSGTGSFHKVNRNGRVSLRFSGSSGYSDNSFINIIKYDNWHHQHTIPQTDVQYAWITSSLSGNYTGSALYGFENKGLDRGDLASSDLVFVTEADSFLKSDQRLLSLQTLLAYPALDLPGVQIDSPMVFNANFVGINGLLASPISSSDNFLGYSNSVSEKLYLSERLDRSATDVSLNFGRTTTGYIQTGYLLNTILLHRQGPYGGANWRLYRKDNHPIVRHQRNNNQIGYVSGRTSVNDLTFKFIKDSTIKNFTEPPITSKYKPLRFSFKQEGEEAETTALLSLGNIRAHFTDHTAESKLSNEFSAIHLDFALPVAADRQKINKLTYNSYAAFKNYLDSKNLKKATEVAYAETIYPKALYTYLSGTRKRINFTNDFWREVRSDRTKNDLKNSTNNTILTSSIWKLDAHAQFETNQQAPLGGGFIPYSASMTQKDAVGELQNCYSLFHYQTPANIIPAVNYNRRVKLLHRDSNDVAGRVVVENSRRMDGLNSNERNLKGVINFAGLGTSTSPALFSASVGDTLWEASSSANYKPFYDSYDQYAEEGFRSLKDGTILPEFRISDKMSDYIDANRNLNYNNYSPDGFFTAYLNQTGTNNLEIESGLLSLTGASNHNTTEEFLNRYAFSDFYDYFKLVEEDYEDKSIGNDPTALMATSQRAIATTTHKLSCEAILKFLPYDGFYPSERTVQLGTIFSQSVEPLVNLQGANANLRTIMQPFFAPGILFNSIKSGIAVDYPIFDTTSNLNSVETVCWGTTISGNFDKRINFGQLIEPKTNTILDAEVDLDFAINSTASYRGTSTPEHSFAMSNFLAETMNLFIGRKSSEQSMIMQSGETVLDHTTVIPSTGTYSFDLHLINSTNITDYSSFSSATSSMVSAPVSSSLDTSATLSSSLQVNTSSITMYNRSITGFNIDPFLYGSSFGPPVETGQYGNLKDRGVTHPTAGTRFILTSSFSAPQGNVNSVGITGSAFDPFTAPYYNGFSTVRVSLQIDPADYDGGVITREEIFASASYTYDRLRTSFYPLRTATGNASVATSLLAGEILAKETTNYKHSMQLSASMFLGDENPDQVIYEREAKINPDLKESNIETRQIIAFKPRWECPVLDFSASVPTESYVSGNVAKGMWHQYGEIPSSQNGIIMKLEPGTNAGNLDMLQLLNINPDQVSKIGKVSAGASDSPAQLAATFSKTTKKQLSEAIIAIPFRYKKSTSQTELYSINKNQVDLIKDNLYRDRTSRFDALNYQNIRSFEEIRQNLNLDGNDANPLLSESKQLFNLMLMMRKYVIPPHLDFLHNDNIDPFVMFMIEYSIDLKQKDLQNMWQNVEPTFSREALKVTSESNLHSLPTTNGMIDNNSLYFRKSIFDPEITRWAVFKVKKRAASNYNSVVGKIIHNNHEYIRKDLKGKTDDFLYSYNWPHDFFSLIELAKINSITTFNPIYSKEKDE